MRALLVVDMIHDFVDGKFGSQSAKNIVPKISDLIEKFREEDTVVYVKDSHRPGDPELEIWGEHAMSGTWGSKIVEPLKPEEKDIVVEKTTYDGFLFTELENKLKNLGVRDVYLCGVATDICVMHTAFGAFARGFKVHVIKDACAGTSREAHERALNYMKNNYGAKIEECDKI